jgi:peroxiredoxin Q/BCP
MPACRADAARAACGRRGAVWAPRQRGPGAPTPGLVLLRPYLATRLGLPIDLTGGCDMISSPRFISAVLLLPAFLVASIVAASALGARSAHAATPAAAAAPAAAATPAAPAAAAMATPAVGAAAPDFTLTSNEGSSVSLKDYRNKWVVLYFYPKDFTSGCTLEAHNFQRDLAKYEQQGAVILGVSVDSADSHKSFCAKEGLSFKLLADTDAHVSTEYGSVMEYNGAKLSARNTFIIDPQGRIVQVFTKVKPPAHSEEVLAALSTLEKR